MQRPCPNCGSQEVYVRKARGGWICKSCAHQFTATSRTILHHRKMPLEKYQTAFDMFRRGNTATAVAKALGCNYRTAWRLRKLAIQAHQEQRNGYAQVSA